MTSRSRCLVDGSVLADLVRCGTLEEVCRARALSVGALTIETARGRLVRSGRLAGSWVEVVERLVDEGVIEVMAATAQELAGVVRWVGSSALSVGELEILALALVGKGEVWTEDVVVSRALRELGGALSGASAPPMCRLSSELSAN